MIRAKSTLPNYSLKAGGHLTGDGVLNHPEFIRGFNGPNLGGLVVNNNYCGIFRSQKVICLLVPDRWAAHSFYFIVEWFGSDPDRKLHPAVKGKQ
jgi:hypothetical protein